MSLSCRKNWPVVSILVGIGFAVFARPAAGQESIKLRNSMDSPITVLVQSAQKNAPVEVRIRVKDIFDYKLKDKGPYTIQVVPDDDPNSGYHLGSHDLIELAKKMRGFPLDLQGTSVLYVDVLTGAVIATERTATWFILPSSDPRFGIKYTAKRMYYVQDLVYSVTVHRPVKIWGKSVLEMQNRVFGRT